LDCVPFLQRLAFIPHHFSLAVVLCIEYSLRFVVLVTEMSQWYSILTGYPVTKFCCCDDLPMASLNQLHGSHRFWPSPRAHFCFMLYEQTWARSTAVIMLSMLFCLDVLVLLFLFMIRSRRRILAPPLTSFHLWGSTLVCPLFLLTAYRPWSSLFNSLFNITITYSAQRFFGPSHTGAMMTCTL